MHRSHKLYQTQKEKLKTYYLRKSTARKLYLDKDRHVKRFKPKKIYTNTITCFACNEPWHLSSACPNRKNLYTKEATLIRCTNLDLIEIQSDISDTSSIYSIVSVEDVEEITLTADYTLINSFTSKTWNRRKIWTNPK